MLLITNVEGSYKIGGSWITNGILFLYVSCKSRSIFNHERWNKINIFCLIYSWTIININFTVIVPFKTFVKFDTSFSIDSEWFFRKTSKLLLNWNTSEHSWDERSFFEGHISPNTFLHPISDPTTNPTPLLIIKLSFKQKFSCNSPSKPYFYKKHFFLLIQCKSERKIANFICFYKCKWKITCDTTSFSLHIHRSQIRVMK